jgi:hypothetical protein
MCLGHKQKRDRRHGNDNDCQDAESGESVDRVPYSAARRDGCSRELRGQIGSPEYAGAPSGDRDVCQPHGRADESEAPTDADEEQSDSQRYRTLKDGGHRAASGEDPDSGENRHTAAGAIGEPANDSRKTEHSDEMQEHRRGRRSPDVLVIRPRSLPRRCA